MVSTEPQENYAPYAPAATVVNVIRRNREGSTVPDPVTTDSIRLLGVPNTMTSRTIRALKFLGLVDESGTHTEAFGRLRRASTQEYPEQLAEIIRASYLRVFTLVDPEKHDDVAIIDAFRQFDPGAQRALHGEVVSVPVRGGRYGRASRA